MTKENIKDIAHFMGYIYFEENIYLDGDNPINLFTP